MVSIETLIHSLPQSKWIQPAHYYLQKKVLLYEIKIRDGFMRNEAVDETTKQTYQRIGSTINIIGKVVKWIQSKDGSQRKTIFSYH